MKDKKLVKMAARLAKHAKKKGYVHVDAFVMAPDNENSKWFTYVSLIDSDGNKLRMSDFLEDGELDG